MFIVNGKSHCCNDTFTDVQPPHDCTKCNSPPING